MSDFILVFSIKFCGNWFLWICWNSFFCFSLLWINWCCVYWFQTSAVVSVSWWRDLWPDKVAPVFPRFWLERDGQPTAAAAAGLSWCCRWQQLHGCKRFIGWSPETDGRTSRWLVDNFIFSIGIFICVFFVEMSRCELLDWLRFKSYYYYYYYYFSILTQGILDSLGFRTIASKSRKFVCKVRPRLQSL